MIVVKDLNIEIAGLRMFYRKFLLLNKILKINPNLICYQINIIIQWDYNFKAEKEKDLVNLNIRFFIK